MVREGSCSAYTCIMSQYDIDVIDLILHSLLKPRGRKVIRNGNILHARAIPGT